MKRTLTSALAAGALSVAVAACGSSGTSSTSAAGAPQRGGTLIVARSADILALDPTLITDNESIWASENIFEPLFASAPNGKTLVPWLATSYTLSPNHLVWTFHLRHGVRFATGAPLTSADVKFSI